MTVRPRLPLFLAVALFAISLVSTAFVLIAPAADIASADDANDGVSLIYNFAEHTCGVQDNVLHCWGNNSNSRLGTYDYYTNSKAIRPIARLGRQPLMSLVDGQTTTTFVNDGSKGIVGLGGMYTTCLIQGSSPTATTGTLYCMGWNNQGQAGTGSQDASFWSGGVKIPTAVAVGNAGFTNSNVLEVDGGIYHTCAIEGASASSTDGTVYCWGDNDQKQLGNNSNNDSLTPVKPMAYGGFTNTAVSGLSVGFTHSCALENDKVFCWGGNASDLGLDADMWMPSLNKTYGTVVSEGGAGRAGQSTGTSVVAVPTPVQAGDGFTNNGSTVVTAVSAGFRHTCAIEGARLYCWGNNDSGQLGDGTLTSSATPRRVVAGGGFTNTAVTAVTAGDFYTCAVEINTVYCWGDAMLGRIGNGSTYTGEAYLGVSQVPQSTPVKVADGAMGNSGNFKLASGTAAHSCALKDGMAYCWGAGKKWGVLGEGTLGKIVHQGFYRTNDVPTPQLVHWYPEVRPDPNVQGIPASEPLNPKATAGTREVTVSWEPPTSEGTTEITNYLVKSNPGDKVCITRLTDESLTRCTFTSLNPGTIYTFRVQALNGEGWGNYSVVSNAVAPRDLRVTGYERKGTSLFAFPVGTNVTINGTAYGYSPSTKVTPWVQFSSNSDLSGTGSWTALKDSNLKTDRNGKFVWNYRVPKAKDGKYLAVYFEINGVISNKVSLSPFKGNRTIFSSNGDLGGMPFSGNAQTDIQLGFNSGDQLSAGLPIHLVGSNLKPGSIVQALLQKTSAPAAGTYSPALWGPATGDYSVAPAVQTISGTVNAPLTATASFVTSGFTATSYAGLVPPGLTLNPTTGVVTGTPAAAGVSSVVITASGTDSSSTPRSATAKLFFAIQGTTTLLPATQSIDNIVGESVVTSDLATTGLVGAVTFSKVSGDLPAGLSLDSTSGVISGVATTATNGPIAIVIRAVGATSGTVDSVVVMNVPYTTSSAVVDDNGDAFTAIQLPNNLAAGMYRIVFSGTDENDQVVSESNDFWVFDASTTAEEYDETTVMYAGDSTPKPAGPASAPITAIVPARLADTRNSARVAAGGVLEVQVTGQGGVPLDATSAVLNLTATEHQGDRGYLTVYACEETRKETSNLNLEDNGTGANAVTVQLGASGKVCVYTFHSSQIIVDVTGYSSPTSTLNYSPYLPTRLLDTRHSTTTPRLEAGQTVEVQAPANIRSLATALALNVTIVNSDGWGWAAVFPCGQDRPNTSTVNVGSPDTSAGSALALLGVNGKVCVYSSVGADILVDIFGWYGESARAVLQSDAARRVLDTRRTIQVTTVEENGVSYEYADDEASVLNVAVAADSVSSIPVDSGYAGDAVAIVANLTVTQAEGEGFFTVYDCSGSMPIVSNLNFKWGETRANQIVIPTTSDALCVYSSAAAHIIVDVVGRYIAPEPQILPQ